MIEPYQHRACLACGKRIPRWVDGKETSASKLFCGDSCGRFYRRGHPTKGVRQNAKKEQVNRASVGPVCATEPPHREKYPTCEACGRTYRRSAPDDRFCCARCAAYVPLAPRKRDGEFFIVAGPVDHCDDCGLAITPRKPDGFLLPYRALDGRLTCLECRPVARRRPRELTRSAQEAEPASRLLKKAA
jgi:hypothetical protein